MYVATWLTTIRIIRYGMVPISERVNIYLATHTYVHDLKGNRLHFIMPGNSDVYYNIFACSIPKMIGSYVSYNIEVRNNGQGNVFISPMFTL